MIERRTDPRVKKIREIRDGKQPGRIFLEGLTLIKEALRSGIAIETVTCAPRAEADVRDALGDSPLELANDSVMKFISDMKSPPGVIATAARPSPPGETPSGNFLLLALDGLQLPQNVGGLLRTAEAAGCSQVWTSPGTADPFGPKSLRGSMGSAFRVPIRSRAEFKFPKEASVYIADARAEDEYDAVPWTGASVLVVGAEGGRAARGAYTFSHKKIRIPMSGKTESLNAAAAAAICLFEAARQRRKPSR